jgi:hypothetical protein
MEHLPIAQDEIGGLKVSVLTIKISTNLIGFLPHIQSVNDRKYDLVLINHFPCVFLLIDRQRDDAYIRLSELFLGPTKVCKLQITEGSPMSSVEKHNIPLLFQIFGDGQLATAQDRTADTRK